MTDNINETEAQNANWAEILTAEALLFSFMNIAFHEKPTVEFIDSLIREDVFSQWPLPADDEFSMRGLELMQAFAANWQEDGLDALKKDYQQLFIGPYSLPAPPWESVYLSVEHLVFERETRAVRQFYARYGLETTNLYKEPDDHFGLEMAFLAHLCGLGLEALQRGDQETLRRIIADQRDFMRDHLLLWAPDFLNRVVAHAQTDYYRGAAHLALGVLGTAAQRRGLTVALRPNDD